MSIALVEKEIARFLASTEPEVLCLRGKWGVGKTYSWNAFLRQAKDKGEIALKSYSYVSLFGVDSLDQLKNSIFENSLGVNSIGDEPSLETFKSNMVAMSDRLGRKWLSSISDLIWGKERTVVLQSVSFLSVREKIICIDDLERKGAHLTMKDVLGLIAHLKEQKACKILLIVNEDELPPGDDHDHFELYNEKIIDASIRFSPDAADCVDIAIKGSTPTKELLREMVVSLNISNIRVIKKIEGLVLRVAPLLDGLHANVPRQAVQSLTLLGWAAHSKNEAPSIDFLRHKRSKDVFAVNEREDITDEEKRWNALLDRYSFNTIDEFDLSLLEGIEQGYFDEETLVRQAQQLNEKSEAAEGQGSLEAAWRLYHNSFDDNEEEVVQSILRAFAQQVRLVTPINLSGLVKLLKSLDRHDEAKQVLNCYVENCGDEGRDFYDLDRYPFGGDIDDPDVRAAFDAKYRSFKDDRSPADVLVRIAKNQGWSRDDITLLSKLSADDFYDLFKKQKDEDLNRIVRTSLQFEQIGGTSDEEKSISAKAKEALLRIGKESKLNRRRVSKFLKIE